jgi:hypothetical protein
MRRVLRISLAVGALSALVAWASFIFESAMPSFSFSSAGWNVLWGSIVICTVAALISAGAGWQVLSQSNSN